MLLCNLVTLGQIRVDIVFPVKLNEGRDTASESEGASDGFVKTVFIQNGKHAWDTEVDKAYVCVWLVKISTKCGYKF